MKYSFEIILLYILIYFLVLIISLIGFYGGICIGIGEMGSISIAITVLPIPSIIVLIISIYYFIKYKKNKWKHIYLLRFSIFIFIMAVFFGFKYEVVERNNVKNCLNNAINIVKEYKNNNNLEILAEKDFNIMTLPKNIKVEIKEDGYTLKYKYGTYSYSYEDKKEFFRIK